MENCLFTTLKASVNNNDLPLKNEVIRLHCNFTSTSSSTELQIKTKVGKGADIVCIGGGGITVGGTLRTSLHIADDTTSNTGAFSLGEYDVAICSEDNTIEAIKVLRSGFSIKNISLTKYYDGILTFNVEAAIINATELPLRDLNKLLDAFPNVTDFKANNLKSGNISKVYGRKFTQLYIDYGVFEGDKNAETIYESVCALEEALTSKYVLPSTFTFKNQSITISHNVVFDGQGGCVVKNSSNVTLGSYDGTSWTYA